MNPSFSRSIVSVALLVAVVLPAPAAPQYTVTSIGSVGMPTGLNNAGQVIGNRYAVDGSAVAELWSAGGTSLVAPAAPGSSEAWGINNAGVVAGALTWTGADGALVTRASLFSGGSATLLAPPGTTTSWASAINDSGQVALTVQMTDGSWRAQLYTPGLGYAGVPDFGIGVEARGLNNRGAMVGMAVLGDNEAHAYLYANGTLHDLGSSGWNSGANAINDSGTVVGYKAIAAGDAVEHATVFVDGAAIDLGTLGGLRSSAFDINQNGDVLGWSYRADGSFGYFLYSNGSMTDLDTLLGAGSAMHVTEATAINDYGQILATAVDEDTTYNLLLRPAGMPGAQMSQVSMVPEPAPRLALVVGLACCAVFRLGRGAARRRSAG